MQVHVTVDAADTGTRAGTETVQVHSGSLPTTAVATPARQLAGFAEVDIAAGGSSKVTIDLDARAFSHWDAAADAWVTPTGHVPVYVGTSSSDTELQATVAIR